MKRLWIILTGVALAVGCTSEAWRYDRETVIRAHANTIIARQVRADQFKRGDRERYWHDVMLVALLRDRLREPIAEIRRIIKETPVEFEQWWQERKTGQEKLDAGQRPENPKP